MITPKTDLYCVIGNPVAHSMSPVMHNRAFSHVGYDGVYMAFHVTDIKRAITGMKALGIKGASITIPHKTTVISLLDEVDAVALEIGAVNTLANRDGKLMGMNTDAVGAVRALSETTGIDGKKTVILGAGGAARAIGFGIVKAGGRVTIANRTVSTGESLATALHADFFPLSEIHRHSFDILVNTTSLGMLPHIDRMPVAPEALKPGMVVMDIVYNPIQTKLLQIAENMGCATVNGVKMFVNQGAAQFEIWTGMAAPAVEMEAAVLEQLRK